jgi:hypothetical protein
MDTIISRINAALLNCGIKITDGGVAQVDLEPFLKAERYHPHAMALQVLVDARNELIMAREALNEHDQPEVHDHTKAERAAALMTRRSELAEVFAVAILRGAGYVDTAHVDSAFQLAEAFMQAEAKPVGTSPDA